MGVSHCHSPPAAGPMPLSCARARPWCWLIRPMTGSFWTKHQGRRLTGCGRSHCWGRECCQIGFASRFLCFTLIIPVLAVDLGESCARCRLVFPGSSKTRVTAGIESHAVGSLRALFAEWSARSWAPSCSRVLAVGSWPRPAFHVQPYKGRVTWKYLRVCKVLIVFQTQSVESVFP